MKNLSYSILLTEKLHFVRFWEKSLWKSPDLTPSPTSQSDPRPESPDLTFRNLRSTQVIGTNQKPTHNPSKESDQSDVPLPRNSFFHEHSLYKQCNPKPGAPPYSHCVCNSGIPSSSLVIKTLLLLHRLSLPGGHWEIPRLGHDTTAAAPSASLRRALVISRLGQDTMASAHSCVAAPRSGSLRNIPNSLVVIHWSWVICSQ